MSCHKVFSTNWGLRSDRVLFPRVRVLTSRHRTCLSGRKSHHILSEVFNRRVVVSFASDPEVLFRPEGVVVVYCVWFFLQKFVHDSRPLQTHPLQVF